MKGLVKLAFLAGVGSIAWQAWRKDMAQRNAADEEDDHAPVGSSGVVRNAGPEQQRGIHNDDWDSVDEQVDESFPASDPPANY